MGLGRERKATHVRAFQLGMAHVLQEAHWLQETDVADVLFPRCYNPSREAAALGRDFRRCQALALLRRFCERLRQDDEAPVSGREIWGGGARSGRAEEAARGGRLIGAGRWPGGERGF